MSWHCSRALVAEYSAGICSVGAVSVPSNTTPMPEAYYWPDKTTEHSRLSRFGMMSEPLTADHGEELLTWFLADFPAKTSAQPEKGRALKANEADSGQKWHGSFARYSPDSSSWKTAQCSLLVDLDEFSETWPRWGSMRNGASYLRQTPALPIYAKGSGLWPTPTVCGNYNRPGASLTSGLGLASAVKMWPTPCARDYRSHMSLETVRRRWQSSSRGVNLSEQMQRETGTAGQLNPEWVEWLMGWPIGWTGLRPLETAKFREWLQQHGNFFPVSEAA